MLILPYGIVLTVVRLNVSRESLCNDGLEGGLETHDVRLVVFVRCNHALEAIPKEHTVLEGQLQLSIGMGATLGAYWCLGLCYEVINALRIGVLEEEQCFEDMRSLFRVVVLFAFKQ